MGDSVCWLNRTCLSCGRFVKEEDFDVCPVCGWSPVDPLTKGMIDENPRHKQKPQGPVVDIDGP